MMTIPINYISKALIKDDETYPDSNDEDGNVTIPLNKR